MAISTLANQWKDSIIIPVLTRLGSTKSGRLLLTDGAVNLLLGTLAVESRFMWIRQLSTGPGRGFFQIEPITAQDVLDRIKKKEPDVYLRLLELKSGLGLEESLVCSIGFQTAIARLKYFLVPADLPDYNDIVEQSKYWKKYYQAGGSKGLASMSYIDAWNQIVRA